MAKVLTVIDSNEVDVQTSNWPTMLVCEIFSPKQQKVNIYVTDAKATKTCYTDRFNTFVGKRVFKLMLPWNQSVAKVTAREFSSGKKNGIRILAVKKDRLPINLSLIEPLDIVKEFLEFAQFICTRGSYLPEGKYRSSNGNIELWVMNELLVKRDGKTVASKSPARINNVTKVIQVNKKLFFDYTVAGRFAVLAHEFAHCFLNKNSRDEEEADFNCAKLYLGLGFPRVDLLRTWAKVYMGNPTDSNVERYNKFKKYVESIDNGSNSI